MHTMYHNAALGLSKIFLWKSSIMSITCRVLRLFRTDNITINGILFWVSFRQCNHFAL